MYVYIIITYGTLYCFWNNLYRGRHCIDNIMTLSDEMFEDFMWQGNNIEEPQNSRNGKRILGVNTIELNRIAPRHCEYIFCKNAGVFCRQHSTNKQLFIFFTFYKLIQCFCIHIFFYWNLFLSQSVTWKVLFHTSGFISRQDLALQKFVSFKTQFKVKMMFHSIKGVNVKSKWNN